MNNSLGNHDCPAIMADGRLFTDYRPSCYVHELILKQNGITNSYDLKNFMITHGLDLQSLNRQYYGDKAGCVSCGGFYLPDPNGHVDYWKRYGEWLGYGNEMVLGCPPVVPAKIPTIMPPIADCPTATCLPSAPLFSNPIVKRTK
jgi:hypothetical protein